MCVFIWEIVTQYTSGLSSPSSSVNIDTATVLPEPKVVVCNWNQDGSPFNSTPSGDCAECLVTLINCQNLNTSEDCIPLWLHSPIQTTAGLFDCYTYNWNIDSPIWSNTTGYSGAIATVWGVELLSLNDPPVNRAGLQASFFLLDDKPTDPIAIYDEVRFAPVGLDTFFAVQYIQTLHQEDHPASNILDLNTSRFETLVSGVNLLQFPNDTYGYIGISFAYQTLNEEIDIFFTSYTLQNFWGDFAGMLGTLMGLDVIKVAFSIPVSIVAVRIKSLNPIEDHFNG